MASKTTEAVQEAIAEAAPSPVETAAIGPHVYRAISEITDAIGKDGISKERGKGNEGATVNFKYRGVDDVYAALNPLLARHGLNIIPNMLEHKIVERQTTGGKPMYFAYVKAGWDLVSSVDGSKHNATTYGEAQDMSDKATNKAMSVAYKYLCFLLFAIPVEGEDNDPDAHPGEDMKPTGKGKTTTEPKPPEETADERTERLRLVAKAEFDRAEALMRACTTEKALDDAWNKQIDWDKIPKSWHSRLQKINADVLAEIRKPKAAPAPAAANAPLDDDIPF